MRKALTIIGKDLRVLARDRTAFLMLLGMPLVLILVLGSVFGSMFSDEGMTVPAAVVDLDGGEIARVFREEVLKNPRLEDILEVRYLTDRQEAFALVERGEAAGCIVVPKGFSDRVMWGEEAKLEVHVDNGSTVGSTLIRGIADAFAQELSRVMVSVEESVRVLWSHGAGIPRDLVVQRISAAFVEAMDKPLVEVTGSLARARTKEAIVSGMDYYAAGMLLMYTVFTAMFTTSALIDERAQNTWTRLAVTPTPAHVALAGKLGYMVLAGLIQVSLVAGASKVFFGVNWGPSVPLFYLVVFAVILVVNGLVLTIGALVTSPDALASVVVPLNFVLSFLGGCMWPVYAMPPWLDAVSRVTPLRWGLSALLSISRGATLPGVAMHLTVLFCMGMVFLAAGVVGLGKRGWTR